MVDDYRDPALETNITTTVTGAATRDPLFDPDPKMKQFALQYKFVSKRDYVLSKFTWHSDVRDPFGATEHDLPVPNF